MRRHMHVITYVFPLELDLKSSITSMAIESNDL